MSEILAVEKKELEIYNYKDAVKRLIPLLNILKKDKKIFYAELHKEYLVCPNFSHLCELLEIKINTVYHYFKFNNFELKEVEKSERIKEGIENKVHNESIKLFESVIEEYKNINLPDDFNVDSNDDIVKVVTTDSYRKFENQLKKIQKKRFIDSDILTLDKQYFPILVDEIQKVIDRLTTLKLEMEGLF